MHAHDLPFVLPDCYLESVQCDGDFLVLCIQTSTTAAVCPSCGHTSRRIHSYYTRSPADLPISQWRVRLRLRVRRFRCLQSDCARQTFAEPLPAVLAPWARRTNRLATAQCRVGLTTGAEAGSRLLTVLRMPASADVLLHLMHRHPPPTAATPRVLGVDDWAWKRGRAWGTLLIDLERRRPVDLLPDRTARTLADWLRSHPGVEIVTRDRSTEYARAITEGAPGAVQVADRWHLIHNLGQVLERFFHSAHARLRSLAGLPAATRWAQRRSRPEVTSSEAARDRRYEQYLNVRRLHEEEGMNPSKIACALGINRKTARKYLSAPAFPEWTQHPAKPHVLQPYEQYLDRRWREGCRSALALYREIRDRGYSNSTRPVHRWAQSRRTEPHHNTPRKYRKDCLEPTANTQRRMRLPAARRLAWLLMRERGRLDAQEQAILAVIEGDAEVSIAYQVAQSYLRMFQQRTAGALDGWLALCNQCGISVLENFAVRLSQDYAAVRAALELPWSNGQLEGQINRLKTLKRQMYGRAKFELLRIRVLHAT